MDSERLQRVQDLFHAALERPASERAAYLDSACQGDAELRSEVERYIAADSGEYELLDEPVRASDGVAHRPGPPSLAGRQIGHYRIERLIGEGGMATVYLADDLKHDRKVALKVLKPELAAVVGAERFLTEIKNTAKLQHPHILPLFDSGEDDGLLFYVMPYVDGESLREKIARDGPLPLEDAVRLLREVADGLAYAHGQGLIHRDIKPGNVLLSGRHATIADFGIAKAVGTSTMHVDHTATGIAIGTPRYMAPEQANAEPGLDSAIDIYAFGVSAYEALTGSAPVRGSTPREVAARQLTEDPTPIGELRPDVPEALAALVMRCLERKPEDRQSAVEIRTRLETHATPSGGQMSDGRAAAAASANARAPRTTEFPATPRASLSRHPVARAVAAGMLVAAAVWLGRDFGPEAPERPEFTIQQLTGFLTREHSPSWSPDGRMITFGYTEHGHMDIYMMSVPGGDPVRLTDHPADDSSPRWSPAGDQIAFVSQRGASMRVFLVPPTGGAEREIANTRMPALDYPMDWFLGLGSQPWSVDANELLFSRRDETDAVGIWKVDVSTGALTRLTSPAPGQSDGGASWSPDGSTIVFTRTVAVARSSLWTMPATGGEPELLVDDNHWNLQPTFRPAGDVVVFLSNRTGALNIWEVELGTDRETPLTAGLDEVYAVAISPSGVIAYSIGSHVANLYLGDVDTPPAEHQNLTRHTRSDYGVRASRDGRLLYHSDRSGFFDIWTYDPATQTGRALTHGLESDMFADRLPDGRVVFTSTRNGGVQRLWSMEATGTGVEPFGPEALPLRCDYFYCRQGPAVSPDGALVGFLARGDDGLTLWVMGTDGTNLRATGLSGGVYTFDWYRDSRRVVYTRSASDASPRPELRAFHLETGEDALVYDGYATEPAVTLDGERVAFLRNISHYNSDVFTLRLMEGEGGLPVAVGEPEQLTDGEGVWHVHNFTWLPDGRRYAYTRDTDDGDIFLLRPAR